MEAYNTGQEGDNYQQQSTPVRINPESDQPDPSTTVITSVITRPQTTTYMDLIPTPYMPYINPVGANRLPIIHHPRQQQPTVLVSPEAELHGASSSMTSYVGHIEESVIVPYYRRQSSDSGSEHGRMFKSLSTDSSETEQYGRYAIPIPGTPGFR